MLMTFTENMSKLMKKYSWGFLVIWFIIPLLLKNWSYGLHVLIMVAVYVLLTQSLNVVLGLAGQLHLGHAANFGIGAYISGLLMVDAGFSFWATLPLAFIGAGLVGLVVGLPTLRGVGGDYLGIVTLGFGEITRIFLTNWDSVTRGPMGLPGIPAPVLFGYSFSSKIPYFYLITIMALASWFLLERLTNSKAGLQFMAVRTDENCAQVLGINTGLVKLSAFGISAAFAGLAGAFYASYFSFISPDSFMFVDSLAVLCMLIVGGKGNMVGCALGALLLGIAPDLLRFMGDFRMLIYGVLLTVMVIYRPLGIWGLDKRRLNKIALMR
jgi:branched-chain amino acid transport system permease protein